MFLNETSLESCELGMRQLWFTGMSFVVIPVSSSITPCSGQLVTPQEVPWLHVSPAVFSQTESLAAFKIIGVNFEIFFSW